MMLFSVLKCAYMNNHIYSTLFKTQERGIEEAKKYSKERNHKKHTQTKPQGHVTLSTELKSTALT